MQRALINMKINGREVTPNLNKLTNSGIYFDNFYSQVSFGTSSDTEFTFATSLLPVSGGTVFINYADRDYRSYYQLLKNKGYYIFSMHANTGDFWNRNRMHQNLGYDKFYDKMASRMKYKYDHKNLACYTCINDGNYSDEKQNIFTVDSEQPDVEGKKVALRKAFYMALGKERNDI